MKTMGFVISKKNNEKRRALLPKDLYKVNNVDCLYFEKGYGNVLGITDEEYSEQGANIASREDVLNCDIIVDVKLGDADYIDDLSGSKILYGWAHAVQNLDFTTKAINGKHTIIAWEEIFEDGRYIFYKNREIAGEAAILQAYRYCGKMPYETKVAILGNGQTAKGALRILHGLGADVDVYRREQENLFKKNMVNYDVLVNCIMWDTSRSDKIIYKSDLKRLKKGCMIIDVSCDPNLEIETSHATTIDDPVYLIDGVIHYAVDNTPAMYPFTVTNVLSDAFCRYVDCVLEDKYPNNLNKAIVIKDGIIIDQRITNYRNRYL